ncbi:MAG: outer membrane protein TolC [Gammaproteobacteria bacterium]|jgi:outer membrane protein TolC
MKNLNGAILSIVLSLTICLAAIAQDKVSLDLTTVLAMGGANNLTIQESILKQDEAHAKFLESREWWVPEIYAGLAIDRLWGSAMNGDGRFFTDVTRKSLWGGLGGEGTWNFAQGVHETQIANLEIQAAEFATKAERNDALLNTIDAYYDFLNSQFNYAAYEQLVAQNKELIGQLEVQVDAGLRYQSDLLLAKSNHNHLKVNMLNAKLDQAMHGAELMELLNLSEAVTIEAVDQLLPLELESAADRLVVNEELFQKQHNIQAANYTLEAMEMERSYIRTGIWLPELKLGGYASVFGDIPTPVYPTQGATASVMWNIPLGQLIFRGEQRQLEARIAMKELHIEQLKSSTNAQVRGAEAILTGATEQLSLAEEGRALGAEVLKQCIERQNLGTVVPFELMQAQENYIQSQLDYLRAVATLNKAQYRLHVVKGNDL